MLISFSRIEFIHKYKKRSCQKQNISAGVAAISWKHSMFVLKCPIGGKKTENNHPNSYYLNAIIFINSDPVFPTSLYKTV